MWVEWVSPYMTEIWEFSDVSPLQSQINEAMQIYAATDDKGKGKVADDAWGFEPGWDNSAPDDNVATSSSSSSWAPWSQRDLPADPSPPTSASAPADPSPSTSASAPAGPSPPASASVPARRQKKNGQFVGETRDEFFQRMAQDRERWIASESAIQRQSRESRARDAKKHICPSERRTGTKIFKWDNGDGDDRVESVRGLLTRRIWSTEWRMYADSQRYYHDFCDQWDLCFALDPAGRPDPDSEEDNYPTASREATPDPPPPYPPSSPAPPPISVSSDSTIWQGGLRYAPDPVSHRGQLMSLQEILHMRFGFVDSPSIYPRDPAIPNHPSVRIIRCLGYYNSNPPATLTPNASYFISVMLSRHFKEDELVPLPAAIHDTTLSSTIQRNPQFKLSAFYPTNERIYIISSRSTSSRRWHLATTSATTALECMRRADTNEAELVSFLVQSG